MQAPQPVRQWLARHGLSLLPEDQGVDVFLRCLTLPQAVLVPVCAHRLRPLRSAHGVALASRDLVLQLQESVPV